MNVIKKRLKESFLNDIYKQFNLIKFRRRWRRKNSHNMTSVKSIFNDKLVSVGNGSYGELNVISFTDVSKLKIGNYCSIAQNVSFVLNAEHELYHISTYPFKVATLGVQRGEAISKGDIVLEDDVWVGYGATILSGVHIGQGAVIGAGALVNKDIPPYAICGGIPAKVIKYRFSPEIIGELLEVDYRKLSKEMIEAHINELYQELKNEQQLEWLPKKGKAY